MSVVADRLPVDPTGPTFHQLELAWRRNEALGTALRSVDLTSPDAIRALELFQARRRILYVHLQAHRHRAGMQTTMSQAAGF